MLFHVYDEPKPEGYFLHEPFGMYRYILDADWFLYILLPILLLVAIGVLMLLWHLHEMPKHKADHKKMRQAELVSALTILGLFEHWVWAVALSPTRARITAAFHAQPAAVWRTSGTKRRPACSPGCAPPGSGPNTI